jgi:hypothetical protein
LKTRNSEEFRKAASERSKKLWSDEKFRTKMIEVLNKNRHKSYNVVESSLQKILYSILDDLKIEYNKEGQDTTVGPITISNKVFGGYKFDCKINKFGKMQKDLLIECNGNYWHSDKINKGADIAKSTFLSKYYSDKYDLLVLWEHEFRSRGLIETIIRKKIGLETEFKIVDFKFKDVIIGESIMSDDMKCLFAKYHYMANIGRSGSLRYGAYYNGILIAAAIFSRPTRNESAIRLDCKLNEVYELSRFVIHPSYQKKNFASYFLAITRKLISKEYEPKMLYTFADTTYGHDGTVYKAAGWKFDGEIKPDYWYRGSDNAWFHKKTIWDHASKNGVTENQYALEHNLHKVIGKKKLRYIFPCKHKLMS